MIWLMNNNTLTKNEITTHGGAERKKLLELENYLTDSSVSYISMHIQTTGFNPYNNSLQIIRDALYGNNREEGEVTFIPFISPKNISYANLNFDYVLENIRELSESTSINSSKKFNYFMESIYQDYNYFIKNVLGLIVIKPIETYNFNDQNSLNALPERWKKSKVKNTFGLAMYNNEVLNLAEDIHNKTVLPENITKEKEKVKRIDK